MSYFFCMCELSHISFNFSAELSYLILCDCQANVLSLILKNHPSLFSFSPCITPTLIELQLIPPHFLSGTVPILWVWMSQKIFYIISRLLLSRHSTSSWFWEDCNTFFVSFSPCVNCRTLTSVFQWCCPTWFC